MKYSRVIAVFIVMFCGYVHASKLTVVTEELSFLQYWNGNKAEGYAVDIINALSELAEEDIDIQVFPWARAYHIATHQPNVLIFSIARSKSREDNFIWGKALLDEPLYFWALKSGKNLDFYNLNENDVFAASRSSIGLEYLMKNKMNNISVVNTKTQNLLLLYKKRVDFIISGELSIKHRVEELNFDGSKLVKVPSQVNMSQKLYFAFSLGTEPEIIEKYQKAYERLISSHKLVEIKRKWRIPENN